MSIFVSVVSYRDPMLAFTIARALETARRPNDVHFGVVDQSPEPLAALEPKPAHLSYIRIDPQYARGPCWARALAMSFYRGEDWFLQVDSHMDFEHWWDRKLINQAQAISPETMVLTSYPNPFVFENGRPVHREHPGVQVIVAKSTQFAADHPVLHFGAAEVASGHPVQGFHPAAGCLFAPGRFVEQFPYDPHFYFNGEEQGLGIRLFTHGWEVIHPVACPIYHHYVDPAVTRVRPLHHEDHAGWSEMDRLSKQRLADLVSGKPLGVYGLGSVRSIADFAAFTGIDYARRTLEPRAREPLAFMQAHQSVTVPGG
jgi:hypothetical protein